MKKTGNKIASAGAAAMAVGSTAWSSSSSAFLRLIFPVFFILDLIISIPGMAFGLIYSLRYVMAAVLAPVVLVHFRVGPTPIFEYPETFISLFRTAGISMFILLAVMVVTFAYGLKWLYRIFYLVEYPIANMKASVVLAIREKDRDKRKSAFLIRYPATKEGRLKDLADFKDKYADRLIPL